MTWTTDYTPGIHHQQSTERRHQLALSWAVRSMSRSTEKYIWPGAARACDFSSCQLETLYRIVRCGSRGPDMI